MEKKKEPTAKPIDFYLSKNGYVEPLDIITMFKVWCVDEGVVMPKLDWPVKFGNGIVGMKCTEDIQNREAFIFVPYKMHFTL